MDEDKEWYGKEVILTGQVKCNDEDEDLKLYAECWEQVMKIYAEVHIEIQDDFIRNFCNDHPSYPDYEDPSIIAYDKNGKCYSAKDIRDKEKDHI